MKKIIAILTVIMVFILPLFSTYNHQKAHASIISKPLTITAKKVAKDLAQDSAVAMAEHILFEKAINEFTNANLDDGYNAVCLDGPVSKIDDCAPEKRVQVKQLTGSDKQALSSKVEEVIERKTNTSSKWGKFLDWFVPIFLISGLVAVFDSMLDGDSESLIDEIAMESLTDLGFIKTLTSSGNLGSYQPVDFSEVVESVTYTLQDTQYHNNHYLNIFLLPNATFSVTVNGKTRLIHSSRAINLGTSSGSELVGSERRGTTRLTTFNLGGGNTEFDFKPYIWKTKPKIQTHLEAMAESQFQANAEIAKALNGETVNDIMNNYFSIVEANVSSFSISLNPIEQPPVKTDFTPQPAVEKIKKSDGTVAIPGIESFKYTYNNTSIYPSPNSTTGWKDKATDIDIAVVEDDVVVDGGDVPIDPEAPPKEDDDLDTDKDKDKIKKKSRDWSTLLTTRFPFSLPWDFLHLMKFLYAEPMTPNWEIKGTEKVPFNLKIDLKFMEPYAPWFRTFIFLSFVMSVIFLHGRFMGGSK